MTFTSLLLLLLPSVAILALVGFWAWMFRDMVRNTDLPDTSGAMFEWPPLSRHGWTMLFICASLPAAALYYQTIYRRR